MWVVRTCLVSCTPFDRPGGKDEAAGQKVRIRASVGAEPASFFGGEYPRPVRGLPRRVPSARRSKGGF